MKGKIKTHLTDASMGLGIRCNNPRARGPATLVERLVTCGLCKAKMARERNHPGRRDNPDRLPPGPAGGD